MFNAIGNTTFELDDDYRIAQACDMESSAQIIAALRRKLEAKEIKQDDVAAVLGVKQPNVATLFGPVKKTGKPRDLKFDEALKLIAAFNLDEQAQPAAAPVHAPAPDALEPLIDALVPLAPPGPLSEQSRRALAVAMSYGLELLGTNPASQAKEGAQEVAARAAAVRFRELVTAS